MSWNPLRRPSKPSRPELDLLTQTNSAESIEKLIAEFEKAEAAAKILYQSAKKIPDHLLCMNKVESKITDDLSGSNQFTDDQSMRNILEKWHSFACDSNAAGEDYVVALQKVLIGPLKQMRQAFTEMRTAIKTREIVHSDVIKFQKKVHYYNEREKTGTNLVKLEESKQALSSSQSEYTLRTDILAKELSHFLSGTISLFQPSLEGYIASEIAWIHNCQKSFDNQLNIPSISESQSITDISKAIENDFVNLNKLSICSDK